MTKISQKPVCIALKVTGPNDYRRKYDSTLRMTSSTDILGEVVEGCGRETGFDVFHGADHGITTVVIDLHRLTSSLVVMVGLHLLYEGEEVRVRRFLRVRDPD